VFEQLRAQFAEDVRTSSWWTACGRLARLAGFAARHWPTFRGALADASYRRHVALVAPGDGYFFASRRAYLVCGLSLPARARAALVHYRNESEALDETYHRAVYQGVGLPLWQHAHEGTVFDIRLTPGNDLLYEGGLSVTFYANGGRITVLSYSNVEPSLLDGAAPAGGTGAPREPLIPFVTRRQSSQHPFRKAFTDAFDRGTPGHFCMAALEGIALAQGSGSLRGVPADRHPAYELSEPGTLAHFELVYDEFWRSLSGERKGPLAWSLPCPLAPTPLAELNSKNRRRALKLRRHLAAVREAAFHAYRARLKQPPAGAALPAPEAPPAPGEAQVTGELSLGDGLALEEMPAAARCAAR